MWRTDYRCKHIPILVLTAQHDVTGVMTSRCGRFVNLSEVTGFLALDWVLS